MSKSRSTPDRELQAMGTIVSALEGLEGDSIQRVLDYVLGRLSITRPTRGSSFSTPVAITTLSSDAGKTRQMSIRDLKDEKNPQSLSQMAALVAYYLSELAPPDEMRGEITAADIQKYFKQAGYKLPRVVQQTLPNAAAAGYFDAAGAGRYRLNPVGYNLVVHGLPRGSESSEPRRRKSTPRRRGKTTKRTKPKKRPITAKR